MTTTKINMKYKCIIIHLGGEALTQPPNNWWSHYTPPTGYTPYNNIPLQTSEDT